MCAEDILFVTLRKKKKRARDVVVVCLESFRWYNVYPLFKHSFTHATRYIYSEEYTFPTIEWNKLQLFFFCFVCVCEC